MTRPRLATVVPLLAALVATAALSGCSGSDAGASSTSSGSQGSTPSESSAVPTLKGTTWVLSDVVGPGGATLPAAPGTTAALAFESGGVATGSTGCNDFDATYQQAANLLTITLGAITQKGCPGIVGTQESAVLAALGKVASFTETDGVLQLLNSSGKTLLEYRAGATGLEKTAWSVTGVGGQSVPSSAGITMIFGADGAMSGRGGCNTYQATYTVTGKDGVTVGALSATKQACDATRDALERQFFAALGKVARFSITGATLTLTDAGGATQVSGRLLSA